MSNAETATFLPVGKVCARYGGRSKMWINRRLADDPTFPRPHYINRLRFWRLSDLEEWERGLATASPYPAPSGRGKKTNTASDTHPINEAQPEV